MTCQSMGCLKEKTFVAGTARLRVVEPPLSSILTPALPWYEVFVEVLAEEEQGWEELVEGEGEEGLGVRAAVVCMDCVARPMAEAW